MENCSSIFFPKVFLFIYTRFHAPMVEERTRKWRFIEICSPAAIKLGFRNHKPAASVHKMKFRKRAGVQNLQCWRGTHLMSGISSLASPAISGWYSRQYQKQLGCNSILIWARDFANSDPCIRRHHIIVECWVEGTGKDSSSFCSIQNERLQVLIVNKTHLERKWE